MLTMEAMGRVCVEGMSRRDADRTAGAEAYDHHRSEFNDAPLREAQAALNLRLFTGLVPIMHDRDKRQGAADIRLLHDDGTLEIVEVTSTTDGKHEAAFRRSETLAEFASEAYAGTEGWLLLFQRTWNPPSNSPLLRTLADEISRELEQLDSRGQESGTLRSAPWIHLLRHTESGVGVRCGGWDADIPDDDRDTPYLDRLTGYLAENQLIRRKLQKLEREAKAAGTHRRHLYLYVTIVGAHGKLHPYAPAEFKSGTFTPPNGITDLWLDTNGEWLYHWRERSGWQFHRMREDLSDEFLN